MLLMIDNYDSFTYNIVQYLGELGCPPEVYRNDKISMEKLSQLPIKALVLSPGPCTPKEAGISCDAIKFSASRRIPVFGVCLGHQCIGEVFGSKIVHAPSLMHGKTSKIIHNGKGIFKDVPDRFTATRYHSLVIELESISPDLEVTGKTEDNVIMAVQHRSLPVYGVQFHPESILTEHGHKILSNFLELANIK